MNADDPIALCLAGRISPEVALARLVLAGYSAESIGARLSGQETTSPAAMALARLLSERRAGIERLARMLAEAGLDHAPAAVGADAALARMRAAFDRAVACSPEASVAAYSLGDSAILDAATAELADWLSAEGLIGPDCDVLDLGCGIGRVAAALAPRCRSVLGLDIAPGMTAEARRRHSAPNLRFATTEGGDLSELPDAGFDLVLAVDSFPYLMQAGEAVAERHVVDAARLLRPGGALAIFNLSYRGDLAADRKDAERWAGMFGFALVWSGETPFALWDGAAFLFQARR